MAVFGSSPDSHSGALLLTGQEVREGRLS